MLINFSASDSFNYTIVDKNAKTATASIIITVNDPYTPPVSQNSELTVNQNTAGSIDLAGKVTGGTSPYEYQIVGQPVDGNAAINGSTLTYTPNQGFSGKDSLTYKVVDSKNQESNASTVNITVKSTDEPLEASALNRTVIVNGKFEFDLENLVSGGTVPYTFKQVESWDNSLGSLILNGSTVIFTSNGSTGEFTVKYSVEDKNELSAYANITVKVNEASQKINATYWCAWGGNTSYSVGGKTITSQAIDMDQIDPSYNVIITAFIVTGQDGNFELFLSNGGDATYTAEQVKTFVENTEAQGRKVIVSLGGALSHYTMKTEADKNNFVQQVKAIVDEYGFKGLDIDLEGSATGSDSALLGEAVMEVVSSYRSQGIDFWLTAAPEWCYITPFTYGSGQWASHSLAGTFYKDLISAIGIDNFTYIWPQTYNQGPANGVTGPEKGSDGYYTKITPVEGMGKFLNAMAWATSTEEGFQANGAIGVFIPKDKLALGIPATEGAAGGEMTYIATPELIKSAYSQIISNNGDIAGFMNWSVDWDALDIKNGELSPGYTHSAWATGRAVAEALGL
ncbi:MAG: hypothetical protein GY750_16380 [Lentisphaerae bacterium]|nr:hypothetical protein [Lentisphaerota bacterium]MCP4102974.1 hypothetical protein [Lentisphaerota bacterium]